MKKLIRIILAVMIFSPAVCFAGTYKTGGVFEIMMDSVSKAGMAPLSGGNSILYQAAGQQAGYSTQSGGTYTLVGGFLSVVDETPPTVSISSPASSASISGAVAVTGTSFDENTTTWTLSYGPGQSPSLWKQIASGASNAVASQMATWNTSDLYGTYTLRVVSIDTRGNAATATTVIGVWNQYQFSATIPANTWSMISFPGNPQNPDPSAFLGSTRFEVQRWDPNQAPDENDLRYAISFPITSGDGFWVKPYGTAITYSLPAWVQNTTQNVSKRIENGWNQIGVPFNHAVVWGNFQFQRDGDASPVSISTAIGNGWLDSSFYSYSSNAYVANDINASLQPFEGYFVRAYTAGTLILDPGAGMPGGVARVVRPVYEWRMRIVARTDSAADTENFIGEMKGAADTFNPADSAEPPTVEPYISAYFPHPDWERAGRYAADIRAPQEPAGEGKVWTLAVRTSEPDKPASISWPDASAVPANFAVTIVDDTTGRVIDPKAEPQYEFTTGADGARTFTITAKKLSAETPVEASVKTTIKPGWTLFSVPIEPTATDAREQLGAVLSKLSIYQKYEQRIFDAASADGVDIQAGIGYWIYADAPVEAGFSGAYVPASATVDVPLTAGWNIIGNPFETEIMLGDNLSVTRGGERVPLTEAVTRGWLSGQVYRFDNESDSYKAVGIGSEMTPWEGYVIKAAAAATLHIAK